MIMNDECYDNIWSVEFFFLYFALPVFSNLNCVLGRCFEVCGSYVPSVILQDTPFPQIILRSSKPRSVPVECSPCWPVEVMMSRWQTFCRLDLVVSSCLHHELVPGGFVKISVHIKKLLLDFSVDPCDTSPYRICRLTVSSLVVGASPATGRIPRWWWCVF